MILVYLGGNVYIFIRGLQAISGFPMVWKVVLSVLFWFCVLAIVFAFAFRNVLSQGLGRILYELGSSWLVVTLYMVLFLLCTDLLRLFVPGFRWGFVLALGATFCLLCYGYYNYMHPKTRVLDLEIDKPVNTAGKTLKVVGVSDLHLGYGTGKKALKKYVKMINEQEPDLIFISGDLIDNSIAPVEAAHMEEELSQLQATLGVYMVPGNHEFISGIEDSRRFIKQKTPIHFLEDEIVRLDNGIQIVGRDDASNRKRKSVHALVGEADPAAPILLLDHQPNDIQEAQEEPIDLQFSGHTHNGQVWPLMYLTRAMFDVSYGYAKRINTHFYVSSGLSLWGPPFRIGSDSEMVVFNLTFK